MHTVITSKSRVTVPTLNISPAAGVTIEGSIELIDLSHK